MYQSDIFIRGDRRKQSLHSWQPLPFSQLSSLSPALAFRTGPNRRSGFGRRSPSSARFCLPSTDASIRAVHFIIIVSAWWFSITRGREKKARDKDNINNSCQMFCSRLSRLAGDWRERERASLLSMLRLAKRFLLPRYNSSNREMLFLYLIYLPSVLLFNQITGVFLLRSPAFHFATYRRHRFARHKKRTPNHSLSLFICYVSRRRFVQITFGGNLIFGLCRQNPSWMNWGRGKNQLDTPYSFISRYQFISSPLGQ